MLRTERRDGLPAERLLHDIRDVWQAVTVLERRQSVSAHDIVQLLLCTSLYVGIQRHGEHEVEERRYCLRNGIKGRAHVTSDRRETDCIGTSWPQLSNWC